MIIYDGTDGQSDLHRIHSQGRLVILRLRGPEQLRTKIGRNLFTLLYHQQLIGSFFEGGSVMEEYPDWMREWYPETPVAKLETSMHAVSSLVSRLRRALNARDMDELLHLVIQAKEMEATLAEVAQELPESWPNSEEVAKRITGKDRPADVPQTSRAYGDATNMPDTVRNITRFLVVNIHRAIRIHLIQALNSGISSLLEHGIALDIEVVTFGEHADAKMIQISEKICRDVPLAIEGYDSSYAPERPMIYGRAFRAWSQLFPLQSALGVKSLSPHQRHQLSSMLEYAKNFVGIDRNPKDGMH